MAAPDLGISSVDRKLLYSVSVVFHAAATVKFNEKLGLAVTLNVCATYELLNLVSEMDNLKAFVHVSTAYSNATRSTVDEKVYPSPHDPAHIMACVKLMPPKTLEQISKLLQGEHPNTYTLTKAIAESLVQNCKDLPVCIVRPSIVTAALAEPTPGWVDNVNGITGYIAAMSRGFYRCVFGKNQYVVDLMPVDLVVNCCILAAWRQGVLRTNHCPVYNMTSGSINPIKWNEFIALCLKWVRIYPNKLMTWYPNIGVAESRLMKLFWEYTCLHIPAFIYDLYLMILGKKARMVQMMKRLTALTSSGEFFARNQWMFSTEQLAALNKESAAARDARSFQFWPEYDWDAYMENYIRGIRKFVLKDSLDTLPEARLKLTRLCWVNRVLKTGAAYYLFTNLIQFVLNLILGYHRKNNRILKRM